MGSQLHEYDDKTMICVLALTMRLSNQPLIKKKPIHMMFMLRLSELCWQC